MQDKAASTLARLKIVSKERKISYHQCLQLFFQEEFLRRLSKSEYVDKLILKGGLFIYTLTNFDSRATVDIDFLIRQLKNDLANAHKMISEILNVASGNDFIKFELTGIEKIALHRKYHGISAQIIGIMKKVRVPFTIDMGFDDIIVPKAEMRNIVTQLNDFEAPFIYTYSLESVIAEKFDAILQRFELTSRMKDFYDIYFISLSFSFEGQKLQEAILKTLTHRGTLYEKDGLERILQLPNDADMQIKWRRFLKSIKNDQLDFQEVINAIGVFLMPICDAIIEEKNFSDIWNSQFNRWQ